MWKKIVVMGIALLGTFSVVYAFRNDLNAFSSTRNTVVTVAGALRGDMKKGDQVAINTNSLTYRMLKDVSSARGIPNSWYSITNEALLSEVQFHSESSTPAVILADADILAPIAVFNSEISKNDDKLLLDNWSWESHANNADEKQPYTFLPRYHDFYDSDHLGYSSNSTNNDLEYSSMYWLSGPTSASTKPGRDTVNTSGYYSGYISPTAKNALRLVSVLNLNDMVFALGKDQTESGTGNLTKIRQQTNDDVLNVRMHDSTLNVSFDKITKISSDIEISEVAKDSKIKLNYSNASLDATHKLSLLILDETNSFRFYKQYSISSETGFVEFETSDLELGIYKIYLVVESINTTDGPSRSSALGSGKTIEIIKALNNLSHTPSHTSSGTDYYFSSSNGNVLSSNKVASLSTSNGATENGVVYKLQPSSSNSEDYKEFAIPTESGTDKPVLDAKDGKPYVIAKPTNGTFLLPGVYKYRVQAYDENGDPVAYEASDTSKSNPYAQLNNGTIVKGITPSQGLITEDITTVVYPHESQISYAQLKDANGEYYKKNDINQSGFTNHLGTLTFATEANMQKLFNEGYSINTTSSKIMKKDSSTEQINALKITADSIDKSKFYIDKNSNVEMGTYEFDAWLYFKNSSGDTALLKVTNQKMYIAPSLTFSNPDKVTEALGKDTYERKYNAYAASDNKENIFTLIASDKSDLTSNGNVKYCIYDETLQACASTNDSDVLTLVDNGNGTATITAKTYYKNDPNIIIRAYIEDVSGSVLTYENITIQINRSERNMIWEGTGISSLNSSVIAKGKGEYELKLPYDSATPIEYTYSKILKDANTPANGTLALRHDEGTGILSSTMSGNLASGIASDSFKLTDKCIGTACYIEVAKTQDDIYEAGTVKLYIVTEDMLTIDDSTITWNYQVDNAWKVAFNVLTLEYKENGITPVKIDTTKLPSDIKNVNITYMLDDPNKVDTISVANKSGSTSEAEVSILQANQVSDNASIKAIISSDNYAKKTVMLPVKVNKVTQTIDFNTVFKELSSSIKIDTSQNYDYSAAIKVDSSTAGKGTISYTVAGNPVDMLTNNSENKTFNVTKAGSVTITATLTDDKNYTSTTKSVSKTITYYADAGLTWTQDSTKPEAVNTINGGIMGDADVNKEVGDIVIDGGKSTAYTFSVDNTKHSDDSTYFTVVLNADNKSGRIKIIKKIDAAVLQTHATQVGVGDTYEWTIHMQAVSTTDSSDKAETDITITFIGAQPDITFISADSNKKIIDTFGINKNIDLNSKRGGMAISDPTISFVGYTNALVLNNDNTALIKAANTDDNDAVKAGRKVEVQAQVSASAGYKSGTSDLHEVIIKKANHPTIDFKEKTLSSSNNVNVLIEGILHGNGKFNEDVTITPNKSDPLDAWVIEPFTLSKGEVYDQPQMAISPKGYLGTIDFTITASGDDNYKALPADTKTTIEFSEAGGIIYKPINVVYGDKTKRVLDFIVSPNPNDDPDTVSYAYSGYDDTLLTIDPDGNITPRKAGTTTLTFKRMDSGDHSEMEQKIKVTIKTKEITIYVNDLHKKVGEIIINDMYSIDTVKSTAFETGDDVGKLTFSCQDNNVEVTTMQDGLVGPAPKTLPINASYIGGNVEHKANYTITYKPGNLNITQDEAQDSWISVLPKGTTTFKNNWYNGDVDVKINAISGSYSEISPDGNAPWAASFTILDEGKIAQEVAFRDPITKAKSKSIIKDIQIDRQAPRVESIKAKSSNNKLEDILNTVTFGTFFKPSTEFTITTMDKKTGSSVNQVSGTNSLTYSIYRVEKDNSETLLEKDKTITIKDETAKIKISDNSGTYKVCTSATDQAGNKGAESCGSVKIGYKDMNISTGDNDCPDINLDFNDDGIAELNIDLDGNSVPDLNIDTDFDGKADINVDTDEDKKPDVNLVNLGEWKPGICSTVDGNSYATMEDIEPIINVAIDIDSKDQKPYLNIDTTGDMLADFNISFDGEEPYLNIGKVPEQWTPETDYVVNKFTYDTMKDLEPLLNMGIIDGKYPSINIDINKDGKADINIDTDGNGIPNVNIDGDGDGTADINIDKDNNGTPDEKILDITSWKPEIQVNGNVPYKTMKLTYEEKGNDFLTDNDVTIEKPNGSFLPNHSMKVNDVTTTKKDEIKAHIPNALKDKIVDTVYDVTYYIDKEPNQPKEKVKVRIPAKAGLRNPVLLVEKEDGTYTNITPKEENGYYIYETDFLGMVSVLGDAKEELPDEELPDKEVPDDKIPDVVLPTPGENVGGSNQPDTSVKGTYTTGTSTGDTTNVFFYGTVLISTMIVCVLYIKKRKHTT